MTGLRALPRFAGSALGVVRRGVCFVWRGLKFVLLAVFLLIIFGNFVFPTDRDIAYRSIDPNSELCAQPEGESWSILSQANVQNDETRAVRVGEIPRAELAAMAEKLMHERGLVLDMMARRTAPPNDWDLRLRCAIQRHTVNWRLRYTVGLKTLLASRREAQPTYDLAFIEFKENGDPYPLMGANGAPYSLKELSARPAVGQLEALYQRLKKNRGNNFVLVFVHGWRHDASLGDGNVADLRTYAARVARHLNHRCEFEGRHCGDEVTAVYIGWRGARVDEKGLARHLGSLGEVWGTVAAVPTLFDRKPVSESIAPYVVSAVRAIDAAVNRSKGDRVIVFGHSLGGNMLLSGLKDDYVKMVERRPVQPGPETPLLKSPIGDLVILINPASEAAKWTEIQRAVWHKIAVRREDDVEGSSTTSGHRFFAVEQRPVIVSVTAALAWPPGGIRPKDCAWVEKTPPPGMAERQRLIRLEIEKAQNLLNNGIEYDLATHDLFPAFKGDLRPLAERFERAALRRAANHNWQACREPDLGSSPWAFLDEAAAGILRNLPFMNTDAEATHTVGHLDPPRNVSGDLTSRLVSWQPFGTTHEITGLEKGVDQTENAYCANRTPEETAALRVKERPVPYHRSSGVEPCACAASTGWLYRARKFLKAQNGVFWDSTKLGDPVDGFHNQPALRLVHGFDTAGIAAITRANDPFWNVRAFDNVLAQHDGYMLSSFICAMNSMVMDDIIDAPPSPPAAKASPTTPKADEGGGAVQQPTLGHRP